MEPEGIHEPVHTKHPELIESGQLQVIPEPQIIEPSDHQNDKQSLSKWLKKIEDLGQKSNRLGEKQHYLRKKAEKAYISIEIYQQLFEEAKKRLENSQRKTENLSTFFYHKTNRTRHRFGPLTELWYSYQRPRR